MVHLPEEHIKYFEALGKVGDDLAIDVYVVGGYARDRILNKPLKEDIDIVCVGSGIELAKKFASVMPTSSKVNYFKNFGTAQCNVDGIDFEFVGARKESYSKDSRKPIVEDGTLEDDQNRRDFTINSLAIKLNKDGYGELVDSFGGVKHIEERLIKTPLDPEITFSDDPLRMMRAIRFASQLNFHIEEETFAAIQKMADRIKIVSAERIITELNKIILSPIPSLGFVLLSESGLLEEIFPEMMNLHGVETINGKSHKDNFYHTLEVLDNVSKVSDDLWLRWAAIMHDIAKPPTKRFDNKAGWTFHGHEVVGARWVPKIFKRMKLPLDHKMKFVQKLVALHLRPIALTKDEVTDSAVRRLLFDAGDDIDELMKLCNADITSKNEFRVKRYRDNFEKVKRKLIEVEEKDSLRNFQPPISGELIMETFAIKPGREVGVIKNTIREAILEGDIHNDYDEAFKIMLVKGKELGLEAKG